MNNQKVIKRLFDIAFASFVLFITSPLILLGALTVKLTSPGQAFYKAKRAGLAGKPFYMFKLRTMFVNTDTPNQKITEEGDSRITPMGRILRKLKIDEFPQFWNVLIGEMSIVGPIRPIEWDLVDKYFTPKQRLTLENIFQIRPGIVCPADLEWYPDLTYHDPPSGNVSIQEWYLQRHLPVQLTEGIRYLELQSLLLDLKVIAKTIFCLLVYSWFPPKKQPPTFEQQELA
ncbi:sugar transferase [Anabaena sp. UHCC 0451]|uniref:sugar transferase n=1 Tax=Anabaena sp. UHCC 0451 TaxID=2055235 RepID=UPI002B1FF68F|nr:sugar transferase [Anabaena sp. UHCC 0451]MEA5579052.1 sugar transferase [Anabaena sp. UHCC 0451]